MPEKDIAPEVFIILHRRWHDHHFSHQSSVMEAWIQILVAIGKNRKVRDCRQQVDSFILDYLGFFFASPTRIINFAGPALPWILQLASATTSVSPSTLILTSFVNVAPSGRLPAE